MVYKGKTGRKVKKKASSKPKQRKKNSLKIPIKGNTIRGGRRSFMV